MTCTHNYSHTHTLQGNDLLFTDSNKIKKYPNYLSVHYHRSKKAGNHKNIWAITPGEECNRFYCAFSNNNKPTNTKDTGYWHIEPGNSYIGTQKEIISYFVAPENKGDPWHGYPFTFERETPKDRKKGLQEIAETLFQKNKLSLARTKKIRSGDL